MDKQTLRRRQRLLKKNEDRMKLLLGKSKDEESSTHVERKDSPEKDSSQYVPANVKQKEENNEDDTRGGNTYNNKNVHDDEENNHSQTNEEDTIINPKIVKKESKENKQTSPLPTMDDFDNIQNQFSHFEEQMNFFNMFNLINSTEMNPLFNLMNNGSINSTQVTEELQRPMKKLKKYHFIILIIISFLCSIIKMKYSHVLFFRKTFTNSMKKRFVQFLNSDHFYMLFALFYNILFLCIHLLFVFIKAIIQKGRFLEEIKNMKSRLTSLEKSDFTFFLLKNISTICFFLLNIVQSYVLSLFCIHIFDDIISNRTMFNNIFLFKG